MEPVEQPVKVCVAGDDPLERRAAAELAEYAARMTGRRFEVAPAGPPRSGEIFASVGRTAELEALQASGAVELPDELEGESFIVRGLNEGGRAMLVLVGGSPAGTLHAVHHYLERCCGVGFFWDGDQVPALDGLPCAGVDAFERPRWPVREYLMDCEYTSWWWGEKEWREEVDWAARHRFNLLSSNFDFTTTWRAAWRRFGVEVPPGSLTAPPFHPWAGWHRWDIFPPYPEEFQQCQEELCRSFVAYGRGMGMRMAPDYRGFLGQVPREFHPAYRDKARFLEVEWVGFAPAGVFIHPSERLYRDLYRAYLEEHIARFGTDHLYPAVSFSEMAPGEPAERHTLQLQTARAALDAITSIDPQATLFTSSWTWVNRTLWTEADVKAFLDVFPADRFQVWEQWDDHRASFGAEPHYRLFDYFHGRRWLFGFLHSYGGTTSLHGDLAGLIRRFAELARDPRADRCLGVAVQTEAMHHDDIWFDLLARLAWNPAGITLEGFLADYARRRYGPEGAECMEPCLRELADSVYGTDDIGSPLYQTRILLGGGRWGWERPLSAIDRRQPDVLSVEERARFVPRLCRALDIALRASPLLSGSPLYRRDLVNIARQLLGDLFNARLASLYHAFCGRAADAVKREEGTLAAIMREQERLLASDRYFRLQPLVDRAMRLPGAPPDYDRRIRNILTVWADHIQDYARRDYYELVRCYYGPRVGVFLDHVLAAADSGTWAIDDRTLVPEYRRIEHRFVEEGCPGGDPGEAGDDAVAAAGSVLRMASTLV